MTHERPFDKPIFSFMMGNSDSLTQLSFRAHSSVDEVRR